MKTQVVEQVTIAQARRTIAQAASIYFSRDQQGRYRMERRRARPICLMGPAGIGKTEVVRQVAEEGGFAFVSYSITHHTRQSAIGLPRLVEGTVDGTRVTMTEYTMSEIIAQVYRTMEETGKKEGILFLDEFNCASESLRPILLQLLQEKSFGPHKIPDGWMLVLAGNPAEYNRAVSPVDPVTADRMRMVYIQPDYAAWRAYAQKRSIHPVILSYLDYHKEHFYVFRDSSDGTALVTARGWEDLSIMMTYLEQAGEQMDLPLVAQYLQCGEVARAFFQYCGQYQVIVGSGILKGVLRGTPKALAAMKEMRFERSWNLLSALIRHIQGLCDTAISLDQTTAAVHSVLKEVPQRLRQGEALDTCLLEAAAALSDRPGAEFLRRCAREESWEALREQFHRQLRQPRENAYQAAQEAISAVLSMCRKAWRGQPHLDFLFHQLCDSPAITEIIACTDIPEFRALCTEDGFDVNREAQALLHQITDTKKEVAL